MTPIDASILTTALDAWERDPASYDVTPFHALSLAHPTEASYLWQLARGARPPAQLVGEALQNLLAWGLLDPAGAMTALGRRLIEAGRASTRAPASASTRPSPPFRARRVIPVEAGRLSDRALHALREIAAGRDRIFAMDERPPGWSAIERLGLAARGRGDRARLTADGEEFVQGVEAGQAEVLDDGWTRESAELYFAQVGAPDSVFDAGHQSGIRAAVGLNRTSGGATSRSRARASYAHSAAQPSSARGARLTPAKVLADLKSATGLSAAVLTRRERRSGLTVRKHAPSLVYVAYDDHGHRGDQPTVWPAVLASLERAGYTLRLADGSIGADATARALRAGAVLVSRSTASANATRAAAGSSGAPARPPAGTWAWTADARVFVPDERVTPRPSDERVPLRGHDFVEAVRRDGEIIGWTERS